MGALRSIYSPQFLDPVAVCSCYLSAELRTGLRGAVNGKRNSVVRDAGAVGWLPHLAEAALPGAARRLTWQCVPVIGLWSCVWKLSPASVPAVLPDAWMPFTGV